MSKAEEVEQVRARRLVVKDILNTNLLSPDGRKQYEKEYAETGAYLEAAVKSAARSV